MKTVIVPGRRRGEGYLPRLLLCLTMLMSGSCLAAGHLQQLPPRWSLELKGGSFFPAEDGWKAYYGDDKTGQFSASIAWKLARQFEVGVGGSYIRDKGKGLAPQQDVVSGDVTLQLYPLQLFAVARGVFSEDQWLVPYVGAGWTRVYYEQNIHDQEKRRGAAEGGEVRGGVQLLLDRIDRSTAWGFYKSFGVNNSYFFLEVERSSVSVGSNIELGGTSYQAGLLFEF